MKYLEQSLLGFCYVLICLVSFSISSPSHNESELLQCLTTRLSNSTQIIYTPNEASYSEVLNASLQNRRFASPSFRKPLAIITPLEFSHVQAAVLCAKQHGGQIRARSGGHDFEGLSYVSGGVPFVTVDLLNLSSVAVDVKTETAWVQGGATLGQVYHSIAEKSATLAFPAGTCPTVGVGGHISGGGYGTLMRMYGLAADNVLDAVVVDSRGRILDRSSMGEELFWAVRGGGAASFGVVLAWKIKLVRVPTKLTVFTVVRELDSNKNKSLVHRWQHVGPKLPKEALLFVRLLTSAASGNSTKPVAIQAVFTSVYLGSAESLLALMRKEFPELGLVREDCTEMSWIESVLNIAGYPSGTSREVLLQRIPDPRVSSPYKGKLDYVEKLIPQQALEAVWERLTEEEVGRGLIQLFPYGGRMSEIPESEIPFPHRNGYMYKILYYLSWEEGDTPSEVEKHLNWTRSVYNDMTPYVTKNPRSGYVNYRDLDLGQNNEVGATSYEQASVWGLKYFGKNFKRLVRVKTMVDPANFFRNEQSIVPAIFSKKLYP